MKHFTSLAIPCFWMGLLWTSLLPAQNVGIGTSYPQHRLHVHTESPADGLMIDNHAADGDPLLMFGIDGQTRFTLGVDDSDADKFKIGSGSLANSTTLTITTSKKIGVRTSDPEYMFHMTNGNSTLGTSAMSVFENLDTSGVSLAAYNQGINNAYNAIEGVTAFQNGSQNPAGVLGLALATQTSNLTPTIGVVGHTNLWQGIGVVGSRRFDNGPDNGFGGQFYYDVGYTGGLYSISDRRTKKDIQNLENALDLIGQLRPVRYQYDTEAYPHMGLNQKPEFGFVAQEVRQVIPEITAEKTFLTGAGAARKAGQSGDLAAETFVVMDYSRLIPLLTQAIKEQQNTIQQLENQVRSLQEQVDQLQEKED